MILLSITTNIEMIFFSFFLQGQRGEKGESGPRGPDGPRVRIAFSKIANHFRITL